MLREDVFPQTLNSWIAQKLGQGEDGRADLNRHLMEVYTWPLQVYYSGCSERWLGEAQDVVQGFFADRLGRQEFLTGWKESGLRLRRWLMNGFLFYLRELYRERKRAEREEPLAEDRPSPEEGLDQALDRAFAVAVATRALGETRHLCESRGLGRHWEVFHRHYYLDEPYGSFVAELGLDERRAATMARTVAGKFRATLRDLLARDGALESEINRELEALLEVVAA